MRTTLALVPLLLFPSCSDTTGPAGSATSTPASRGPVDTARAFLDAARDGDRTRFEGLLTDAALEGLNTGGSQFSLEGENLGEAEIGMPVLSAGRAEVPVSAVVDGSQQEIRLVMREEEAEWRVSGLILVLGEGMEIPIDFEAVDEIVQGFQEELAGAFEEAFTEWSMGGSPEEVARTRASFEAIRGIPQETHERVWRIDVVAQDRPALDVLAEIVEGTGLAVDPGAHAAALAREVTLVARDVSRLEACERVCRAVDMHPVYPELGVYAWGPESGKEEPTITFEDGERDLPVAFAGPFLIEVGQLEENPPNATGRVTIVVRALGLAPEVMAFQTEMMELFRIGDVLDARGRSVSAHEGVSFYGTPAVEGRYLVNSVTIDLRNLVREVEVVASVGGSLRLKIPTAVDELRWARRDRGPKTAGELTVSLGEWGDYTRFQLAHPSADLADTEVRLGPLNADGEPLGVVTSDSSAYGRQIQAGVQAAEAPAAIDLKLCSVGDVVYPFELVGIPLARHAEQPERLEPLRFKGACPIVVEFVRFTKRDKDFPEVELRFASTANKDAVDMTATLVYFNGAGQELGDAFQTFTGPFDFEGSQPLVVAGATTSQETVAFFMPAETVDVRVRVENVTFADASEWKLE